MKNFRHIVLGVIFLAALQSCSVSKYTANTSYPQILPGYQHKGELREVFYDSSEPGLTQRRALVYLPVGYENSDERYPVLYLLHGARGNECVWINKGGLLKNIDSLYAASQMLPTIVVLPNVNQYNDDKDYGKARLKSALESFYEVDGTVETYFIEDVVAATDSLFRTIPDKEHRAVAGLSIGAMQSIHLSANYPDKFGYVGMFSPMVHSFIKAGPDNSFYKKLPQKQQTQFLNPPALYLIMIGKTDFFYPFISGWSRKLDKKGYTHEIVKAPGGHEWYNWTDFCNNFLERLWR